MNETELKAQLDATIAAIQADGVQGPLINHLFEIKAAWDEKNWLAMWRAVRDTVDHLIGDEGMGADSVGLPAWLPIAFQLIQFILERLKK